MSETTGGEEEEFVEGRGVCEEEEGHGDEIRRRMVGERSEWR